MLIPYDTRSLRDLEDGAYFTLCVMDTVNQSVELDKQDFLCEQFFSYLEAGHFCAAYDHHARHASCMLEAWNDENPAE